MKGASPQVLLVEDDPISREVLALALAGVPAAVTVAASLHDARAALADTVFDAWLVDAHLPDGAGIELLSVRPASTMALAHTAATDATVLDRLIAAGFAEVLVKPLAAADVQAVVRRVLGLQVEPLASPAGCAKHPTWDDAAALRALGGDPRHVAGLRGLFVRELEPTLSRLHGAFDAGDAAALHAELHRLAASCGFVGAARLGAAVAQAAARPLAPDTRDALDAATRDTLETPYPSA